MSSSPCSLANVPWSPRQILIDDTDSRITYNGNWTTHREGDPNGFHPGWWGRDLYDLTSHRLILGDDTSSLGFQFRGTAVNIVGNISSLASNPSRVTTTTISCLIDGQQKATSVSGENLLCGVEGLDDGDHDIVLVASAPGNSTPLTLSVDVIQYTPSAGQELNTSDVSIIDACDTSIDYGGRASAWNTIDTPSNHTILNDTAPLGFKTRYKGITTNQYGAQLSYKFTGRNIEWIGVYPGIQDGSPPKYRPADAEFAIYTAGKNDSLFVIHLSGNQTNLTEYDGPLWGIYGLFSDEEHTLVATYKGGPGQAPLTFSYLKSPTSLLSSSHSRSHTGAIVGGVVGGVVGLSLLLGLAWVIFFRKRRATEDLAWSPVAGGSESKG